MTILEIQTDETIYREIAPHEDLQNDIQCYWTMTTSDSQTLHRIIPDGGVNVLFEWTTAGARCRVVGPLTGHFMKRYEVPTEVLAVRFKPGGASDYFEQPIHQLTDKVQRINKVWQNCQRVRSLLTQTNVERDGVFKLNELLLAQMQQQNHRRQLGELALHQIVGQPTAIEIEQLASDLGKSRQQVTRAVKSVCGISPKRMARILRLQRLVSYLRTNQVTHWAMTAIEFGFYDQAHMTREFVEFAGTTPAKFVKEISR